MNHHVVFANITFVQIFARVILEKDDIKRQWHHALTLILNIFSWLSKTMRKIIYRQTHTTAAIM